MDITQFLQKHWYSRRNIITLLESDCITKNHKKISFRKEPVEVWDIIEVSTDEWIKPYTVTSFGDSSIILYNKPIGVVTSHTDPHNDTIFSLLPPEYQTWFYYIGRLDKDSHGLLVLTNISQLVSYFSHPRYSHTKTYIIQTNKPLTPEDREKGRKWVAYYDTDSKKNEVLRRELCEEYIDQSNIVEKKIQYKDKLSKKTPKAKGITYKIQLREWKKRHIRRLCEALWYTVTDLQRISLGPWSLDDIPLWQWKEIKVSPSDLENLLEN